MSSSHRCTVIVAALAVAACAAAPQHVKRKGVYELDAPDCELPEGTDIRFLDTITRAFERVERHYASPDVPYRAMYDAAIAALRARYPDARIPDSPRAVESRIALTHELHRAAKHTRCTWLFVAAADPEPEHILVSAALQALPLPGGVVRVDGHEVAAAARPEPPPPSLPPHPVARNHERLLASGVLYLGVADLDDKLDEHLASVFASPGLPAELRGVILDLRGCTGGRFDTAVRVADRFLPAGTIARTRGRDREENHAARAAADDVAAPLVVLVDGATSAGAEVIVAALQHHQRARVVGEPTLGHGVVKVAFRLPSGGEMFLPIAEILRADGVALHGHGITPDVTPASGDERDPVLSSAEALLTRRSASP